LLVYDRTCTRLGLGLSTAWSSGSLLYRGLGRLDAAFGASSWDDALGWLASVAPAQQIAEIQYWGHGKWGSARVGDDVLDGSALRDGHRHASVLAAIRERLTPDGEALIWLRTCESFGATAGLDFAQQLADHLGARVAGHTFVIGVWQSGLHGLRPGCRPTWSATEGLAEGTAAAPVRAHRSSRRHPHTVTCLTGVVPEASFAHAEDN
jgi:hypothetical protein